MTLYEPVCRLANWYAPASFVRTVVTMPVPVFVAVTDTPGINAPEASETVPPRVALLVWANTKAERNRNSIAAERAFIWSPEFKARRLKSLFYKARDFITAARDAA